MFKTILLLLFLLVSSALSAGFLHHGNVECGLFFSVVSIAVAGGWLRYRCAKKCNLEDAWLTLKFCLLVGVLVSSLLLVIGPSKDGHHVTPVKAVGISSSAIRF